MALDDIFGGAATGGVTGAAAGSVIPGVGTALGAGVGALVGGVSGWFRGNGRDKQKEAMAKAREQLQAFANQQRVQREQDLQRALSYFQPAQQELKRLYGGPG